MKPAGFLHDVLTSTFKAGGGARFSAEEMASLTVKGPSPGLIAGK